MNFKTATLVTYVICASLLCVKSFAQNSTSEINQLLADTQLKITPSVCVVRQRGEQCEMRVNVFWKTSQEIDGCLYANSTLLRCWTDKQQVEERLDILLQENMTFTLQYNQHILATQEVKVNASQSTKYRRRLRSKWSLF